MAMRFPLPELKVRGVSSSIACTAAGKVSTGASFTALTVIFTVSVSLLAPPEPELPWSLVTMVMVVAPLKLGVGA